MVKAALKAIRRAPAYRNAQYYLQRYEISLRRRLDPSRWTDADPYKILYLHPSAITCSLRLPAQISERERLTNDAGILYTKNHFHKFVNIGRVVEGGWDRSTVSFSDNIINRLVRERYGLQREWQDTTVWQLFSEMVDRGEAVWHGCTSREALAARGRAVDELFESVRKEGYRSRGSVSEVDGRKSLDEIAVNIDRNGRYLYNSSGSHRLSIAQCLMLEQVPVRVLVRHRQWQDVREEILRASGDEDLSEKAKRSLWHPDLQDIVPGAWRDTDAACGRSWQERSPCRG
jgi:hypothetical protein